MNLPQVETEQLFDLKKYQADGIIVNFPIQGEDIMIELQNDTGRIKFIADINNANEFVRKATFQVRYQKIFVLRRLDLNGNHKNPPDQIPDVMFHRVWFDAPRNRYWTTDLYRFSFDRRKRYAGNSEPYGRLRVAANLFSDAKIQL